MTIFLAGNVAFFAVFIYLAVIHPPLWVWGLFVAVWCLADYAMAKDIHLAWWHWALLIGILTIIDVVVLLASGQIRLS